jgi:peptide/nickel transport system substrate-binding protein
MIMSLVAAACGGSDNNPPSNNGNGGNTGDVPKGGVAHWESEEFGFTNGFDPTGEYLGEAWSIFTNLLSRSLMGYNHVSGAAGNELVPDLADGEPEVSSDGLTYTFTLKDGVMFGPPLSRPVTASDVEFAFRRIATESLVAQYQNYYVGTIKGLELGKDPGPGGISGIEVVDDKTIKFTLTKPTGDFLYRLAMPATAPMPEEVAGCFDTAGDYGRYVISSSSYMFEGSENLDASSCKTLKPISGYDPTKQMILVRNPDYDQSTDDTRENNIDSLEHTINTNTNDIEQKVLSGESEFVYTPTPQTLRKYVQDPDLKDRLHVEAGDRTWYITMNLNAPPFDDIHIRKAANFVMDKDGLQRAWGGPTAGEIAGHIVPDTMLNGLLDSYNPYGSADNTGDVDKAMAEVKQSKYDTNGDGKCDESPECQGVLEVGSNTPPNTDMLPVVENSLEKIGITLDAREVADAYTPIQTVERQIPISIRPGWGKDYADAFTFVGFLFDGRNILCTGNTNYSLVGMQKDKADECGVPYAGNIPGVDDGIDACSPTVGDERVQCWADLDKRLMEDVVPWVPYLDAAAVWGTSPAVVKWEFDQFATTVAWSRIAIDASLQK